MFWCGDFNYRIDLTYEEVFYFVKRQDWKKLLEFDQLKLQKATGKVSPTWNGFSSPGGSSTHNRVNRADCRRQSPPGQDGPQKELGKTSYTSHILIPPVARGFPGKGTPSLLELTSYQQPRQNVWERRGFTHLPHSQPLLLWSHQQAQCGATSMRTASAGLDQQQGQPKE